MNTAEKITLNNNEQWIMMRGKNINAPLLIHVQAGPGLPMIPEADAMEKALGLEEQYLVAYWDQRGCGKSFHDNINPTTITLAQMSDDIIECTKYLLKKYKKDKAILVGYSIGATTSLMAASKDDSLFSHVFLVGMDIDMPKANAFALEFAMAKAKALNNDKLVQQIVALGKHPIRESKKFQERAKILTNLGGIKNGSSYNQLLLSTIKNMLLSKAYSLADIPKTIKGMDFCQNALLPELNTLNLFEKVTSVGVSVHFLQGKLDGIAPYQTAVDFYQYVQADHKSFTDFEHSAHLIQYEESEKFAQVLNEKISARAHSSATPV
jgi:pimeloyl-ACP methyl ester carboxylesterase